jgi:hypothetical protein
MVKGFFKNLPKKLVRQLIKFVVIYLIVLGIHTYLVVVKNEGFSADPNNPFISITNLQGAVRKVTVFWAFVAFFVTNVIGRMFRDGFMTVVKEVASSPAWLYECMKKQVPGRRLI